MKRISFYLNVAASVMFAFAMTAGLQSCVNEDNPTPDEAEVDTRIKSEGEFLTALNNATGDVVLELAPDAVITLTDGIDLSNKNVTVLGQEDAPATIIWAGEGLTTNKSLKFINLTLEAAALQTPLVKLAEVTLADGEASAPIKEISFTNVRVNDLAYQLIYANKQKYLIDAIKVENSIIAVKDASKKTIFDFNGGGNVALLSINNSTLWANKASEWQNGGFYSSQSGQGVNDLGGTKQTTSITNSTLYNISYSKTTSTRRRNSQSWQLYQVKNSIIANSGKKGEFLAGLNAGQAGNAQNWDIGRNIINFDGVDVSENEANKIKVECAMQGTVNFADAESGDFTQNGFLLGDPRWYLE